MNTISILREYVHLLHRLLNITVAEGTEVNSGTSFVITKIASITVGSSFQNEEVSRFSCGEITHSYIALNAFVFAIAIRSEAMRQVNIQTALDEASLSLAIYHAWIKVSWPEDPCGCTDAGMPPTRKRPAANTRIENAS